MTKTATKGRQTNNKQQLAVDKRMTYESLYRLRRRFASMSGRGWMQPIDYQRLCELLDDIEEVVACCDLEEEHNAEGS